MKNKTFIQSQLFAADGSVKHAGGQKDFRQLVIDFQRGQQSRAETVTMFGIIGDRAVQRMMKHHNPLIDDADIEAEYWAGVVDALYKVEFDGVWQVTMLPYIVSCGKGRARLYIRKQLDRGLACKCNKCGRMYSWSRSKHGCPACGIKSGRSNIERIQPRSVDAMPYGMLNKLAEKDAAIDIINRVFVEQLLEKLGSGMSDQQRSVLRWLTDEEIAHSKHYLKEIGKRYMKKYSIKNLRSAKQCVLFKLRSIREQYDAINGGNAWKLG